MEPDKLYDELTVSKIATGAELIVLGGPPYSGKSTYAAHLEKMGYVHVWLTVIKKQLLLNDESALQVAETLVHKLLVNNYPVVFDYLNHKAAVRNAFLAIADTLGVSRKLIWFDVGLDELYLRRQNARFGLGRSDISVDTINKIVSETEVPQEFDRPEDYQWGYFNDKEP